MTSPIEAVAARLGLTPEHWDAWGPGAAKVRAGALWPPRQGRGRLILVSAITPTPAGEGKTTTAISLAQGIQRCGQGACVALREPSIAPILGVKGGGTGAGLASLVPADRIDLHFTGDLHAISLAHNTLAALLDDALHRGRMSTLDPREATWRRVVDVGDRALRHVVTGLGSSKDGLPRQSGFDISASSEIMAILALARDPSDLRARLARILLGFDRSGRPFFAGRLDGLGAIAALLADALRPNLVQTTEGVPAIVHTGPFANIAHGCSSVLGTRLAMAHAPWTVTEAGFGFDLGGEKFLHLKAPTADVWPDALVIVVTRRALAWHGDGHDPTTGLANLDAQVRSARAFGLEPVVAINAFPSDTDDGLAALERALDARGLPYGRSTGVVDGGAGAVDLARVVMSHAKEGTPRRLYPANTDAKEALEAIATTLYGADRVGWERAAEDDHAALANAGLHRLPVCVAKTPASMSDDPARRGAPTGHTLTVRRLLPSVGAGHLVALCGNVLRMPGLPERPRAFDLGLSDAGRVIGLHDATTA